MDDFDSYDREPSQRIAPRKSVIGLEPSDFRKLAHVKEIQTHDGNACYWHRVGRFGEHDARTTLDRPWSDADTRTIDQAHRLIETITMLQVDLLAGRGEAAVHLRVYVPAHHADLAFMAAQVFEPAPADKSRRDDADVTVAALPEWPSGSDDPHTYIDVERGMSFVLGTDWFGELHAAMLRLALHKTRAPEGIALCAAATELRVRIGSADEPTACGLLFVGPSGTGKTALASHDFALDLSAGERSRMRQDAAVVLEPSGRVRGMAGRGFYIRTDGLNLDDHLGLYDACAHEQAVLENVRIHTDGCVDYYDTDADRPGRAVVPITTIPGADGQIDLPACTHLFILTHNPWLPPVARLSPEQAAAAYLLGETISLENEPGSDPTAVTAVQKLTGANPLLLGSADADGNRLCEHLRARPDVGTYLLNTGRIGLNDAGREIPVSETITVIREICRGGVEWAEPDRFGIIAPKRVAGITDSDLLIETFVPEAERDEALAWLRQERRSYLERIESLDESIRQAVY